MRVIGLLSEPRSRLFRVFRAREEEQQPDRQHGDGASFDDFD